MKLTWADLTCPDCGGPKSSRKAKRCFDCHFPNPKQPSTGTHICPKCAGPKSLQANLCQWCWYEVRHPKNEHTTRCPCPECRMRESLKRTERRRRAGQLKGTTTGRPQPQSHPWRRRAA